MKNEQSFNYEPKDRVSDSDLNGKFKHQWVEENFSNYQKSGQTISVSETRGYLGPSLATKKIIWLLVIIFIGIAVIGGKIFFLQIVKGDYYRNLAENNRVRIKPIPAERGLIYDRFGNQLIENVPSFSLSIVPQDLPQKTDERRSVISQIAGISGVSESEINALVKKYSSYSFESLTVKDNLDYESALTLYIQNANLPGIIIEKGTKRLYRESQGVGVASSLSQVIGYLGKISENELNELRPSGYYPSDYLGKDGLENSYETALRGVYGRKKIEVNALGREQSVIAEEAPVPGKHLVLSLDIEAQSKMEELILKSLSTNKWKRAAGVALNPQTGEVLAMVSIPAYNNNDFSGGISQEKYSAYLSNPDQPLFNRAIAGMYPSGSIVKPLIAAAALQEGIINQNTSFLSTGGLEIDKWFFKDWKAGGHGITNVKKALAWSVNTFFYYIGGGYNTFVGLGADKIVEYLKKFSLANTTGIDLPGESAGFLPSKKWKESTKNERWYIGDTYNLSIGQGDLLVTPLQAAVWTAAIANGGKVIKPRLVNAVLDPVSKKSYPKQTEYLNRDFISPGNIEIVRQGMRECVVYGSCGMLNSLPFTSAGKTGTAQWSATKQDHAWFTSFAPFKQPQIVVTVLVEEGTEGSTAAQPIAERFLEWWGTKYLK
ncbi:MAG: penicillin-binding protein 2 [Candidatus Magasanikbacteria bacterium]|nr:penicillin-binding protein 2 [Candidatus Magasanikbacteria bacterium]